MRHPKPPASSRTQRRFVRMSRAEVEQPLGGMADSRWAGTGGLTPPGAIWDYTPNQTEPHRRERQTPAIYTPSSSGSSELKSIRIKE